MLPFYLVNQSTLVSDADLATIAAALDIQWSRDISVAWGRASRPVGCSVSSGKIADVPKGSSILLAVDDGIDPGALGEHWEEKDGSYRGAIALKICNEEGASSAFAGACPYSTVFSHEMAEAGINGPINRYADQSDGYSYSEEICDPVENDYYHINVNGVSVPVSNFVLPAWFDENPPKGAKFDFLGKLAGHAPAMSPNGYLVRRMAPRREQQLTARFAKFGDQKVFGPEYPDFRKKMKAKLAKLAFTRAGRIAKK